MKRLAAYILIALAVIIVLASCSHRARIIPKSKLKKIYTEMLITDQWIGQEWTNTRIADTSLVYEPILEKYGYNAKDYRRSVAYYMNDPDRFARIFEEINKDFTAIADVIDNEEKAKHKADSIVSARLGRNFRRADIYPYRTDFQPYDSIAFSFDTIGIFHAKRIEPDTLYHGPEMLITAIPDKADSLMAADSLSKAGRNKKLLMKRARNHRIGVKDLEVAEPKVSKFGKSEKE